MTEERKDAQSKPADAQRPDSEEALQQELQREQAEGKDTIGDEATDRNLSGSSTWTTLPSDAKPKPGS